MGVLGANIGNLALGGAGEFLGRKYIGGDAGASLGKSIGSAVGTYGGALLPFKKGGRVPGPKGKAKKILAHGGEYVLPVGVAPTKAQKAAVAKMHKKGKK